MVRSDDLSFVVADIPGLIEGAAEGKGLGHQFLRHIERTALILHVLDVGGGLEGRDPLEDYQKINRELGLYAQALADRPQIIVINKVDMPGAGEQAARIQEFLRKEALSAVCGNEFSEDFAPPTVFAVSAVTGEGMPQLIAATAAKVHGLRSALIDMQDSEPDGVQYDRVWEHKRQRADVAFEVSNLGGGVFTVVGKKVERMVIQTEWDNEEAIDYLQKRLEKMGVEKALLESGAKRGDEIRITNRAFAFEPSGVQ
jgi:GTP-binding protein